MNYSTIPIIKTEFDRLRALYASERPAQWRKLSEGIACARERRLRHEYLASEIPREYRFYAIARKAWDQGAFVVFNAPKRWRFATVLFDKPGDY